MKRRDTFSILLTLALATLACRAVQRGPEEPTSQLPAATFTATATQALSGTAPSPPTNLPSLIPATGTEEAQEPTSPAAVTATETPVAQAPPQGGKPPQSQSVIRPPERRDELSRISVLIGFEALDREGASLGAVSDFVINTCETYIIYFLISQQDGNHLFAPYEALTVNSGALDAQAKAFQLSLSASQLAEAPAFPEDQELVPTDWEEEVRAFWGTIVRVSNLTSGCRVSAPGGGTTEVHKVAYASELIGAVLHDGLQNKLGTVEEIILSPESGKVSFFVTRLQDGGLVLVPLRVVNIPRESLGPGTEISLVLLTENERLLNAPRIGSLEEAIQMRAHGAAQNHWGR